MNESTFLAAILAAPHDWAPRLVFADWLEERGDPRGEMLRLGWEVSTLPAATPRRDALDVRLGAWWRAHREAWLGDGVGNAGEILFDRGWLWVNLVRGCRP